jgi:Protein of unknown function (DUF2934)
MQPSLRTDVVSKENLMSSLGSREKAAASQGSGSLPDPLEAEPKMTDRNDRIREIAYFLWLEDGCPDGADERHWLAAETLFDSEPVERKRIEGEPPGEPVGNAGAVPRARGARAS